MTRKAFLEYTNNEIFPNDKYISVSIVDCEQLPKIAHFDEIYYSIDLPPQVQPIQQ